MTYQETLSYLYEKVPSFQRIGGAAYKEGLENTHILDHHFGHPHTYFKSIHIAGTNGKGSCAHTIAAILQSAGYKVGLYTSPHLLDFRERIRVNGKMISQQYVIDFVEKERHFFEPLCPTFFELTTAMAFLYFKECNIDIALIEVGLGGRLDCTNIIHPILSVITNISFDHTQFLGHSLAEIAYEKAGIIKPKTPVVIGETVKETYPVFKATAKERQAPITFAEESQEILSSTHSCSPKEQICYRTKHFGEFTGELTGFYQEKNTNTILNAILQLQKKDIPITTKHVAEGFAHVSSMTGIMGRWQKIQENPTVVCDTGHNEGGMSYITEQLAKQQYHQLHILFGMVNDKDIDAVLSQLPKDAHYYFTKAAIKRAMDEKKLHQMAQSHGLTGENYENVDDAYNAALSNASEKDFIYVGGSSYIVADFLASIQ